MLDVLRGVDHDETPGIRRNPRMIGGAGTLEKRGILAFETVGRGAPPVEAATGDRQRDVE